MDRSADNLGQIINDIQRELEELKTTQLRVRETLYPVGSIYMSATMSTVEEVQTTFGGTWEAWGSGKVPVGVDPEDTDFSTVQKTGGEKTHKLTINEMPSHNHGLKTYMEAGSSSAWTFENVNKKYLYTAEYCQKTGGDQAHNNLQPYITCYMFKRIA